MERGVHGTFFITRGDNTPYPDPPWTPDQIVGEVVRIIRADGDFAPDNRITCRIRLQWAYAYCRHKTGQLVRKLVRLIGRSRSLPS